MNRTQKRQEKRDAKLKEKGLRHLEVGEKIPRNPRVPKTKQEMKMHLTKRYPHLFRDPITRAEKRAWDKFWKLKGAGWTKPMPKGERYDK